ncbi:hypothetical protein TpMuguga_04g02595 [Theileria parva strain Muguga]|uniref:uncharacterized protein n=1 Tax=Theileria parva strain Muguga TaxID=333668 RepID=UPI001C61A7FD|nr:uncharacterized protein TpMuguga_04g02595 [Theileria parva strain Muguga]KAF5153191.1 hypothetical protein TpMuguga_04g02595 [Theileria parva strain Muguga]
MFDESLINKKFRANLRTKCFSSTDSRNSGDSANSEKFNDSKNSTSPKNSNLLDKKRFVALLLKNSNSLILLHLIIQRNLNRHSPAKLHSPSSSSSSPSSSPSSLSPKNSSSLSPFSTNSNTYTIDKLLESDDMRLSVIINVQEPTNSNTITNVNTISNQKLNSVVKILSKFTPTEVTEQFESPSLCAYKLNNYLTIIIITHCHLLHNTSHNSPHTTLHTLDYTVHTTPHGTLNTVDYTVQNTVCTLECDVLRENYEKMAQNDPDSFVISWNKLLYNNVRHYFNSYTRVYLLLPDCVEDICKMTLLLTCLGLGGDVANSTAFHTTLDNVTLLRPLKTLTQEQLSFYAQIHNVNTVSDYTAGPVLKCIEELIAEVTQEHNNSLHNIINITNKLNTHT